MPTFYPENNTGEPQDDNGKSLHKIVDQFAAWLAGAGAAAGITTDDETAWITSDDGTAYIVTDN